MWQIARTRDRVVLFPSVQSAKPLNWNNSSFPSTPIQTIFVTFCMHNCCIPFLLSEQQDTKHIGRQGRRLSRTSCFSPARQLCRLQLQLANHHVWSRGLVDTRIQTQSLWWRHFSGPLSTLQQRDVKNWSMGGKSWVFWSSFSICPQVTLCVWQDDKIQSLTNFFLGRNHSYSTDH